MFVDFLWALLGGALIGLASVLLLAFNGRIAGISGILGGLIQPVSGDTGWRVAFALGLVGGGAALSVFAPTLVPDALPMPWPLMAVAGLLVGFGARLGSGCTSGHGVCGIGRLSPRSFLATGTFVATGAITVFVMRQVGVMG